MNDLSEPSFEKTLCRLALHRVLPGLAGSWSLELLVLTKTRVSFDRPANGQDKE